MLVFSGFKIYSDKKSENAAAVTTAVNESPAIIWNGAAANGFSQGSGKEEDPFIIENGGQLAYLSNLINDGNSNYTSSYYRLSNDILLNDISDYKNWDKNPPENKWLPIGSKNGTAFKGVFDGADHKITGLYISNDEESMGLFGSVKNGLIKNLTLEKSYVKGGSNTGGIAGSFISSENKKSGFDYCSFYGSVISSGDVSGGIAGECDVSAGEMSAFNRCVANGKTVSENFSGGLIGKLNINDGSLKITDCFNASNVKAKNESSGGILGFCHVKTGGFIMASSYNIGKISALKNSGGIAGETSKDGGRLNFASCYTLNSSSDFTASVLEDGGVNLDGIKILTDDEMKKRESFKGFNFDEIWRFDENSGYKYPVLIGSDFLYEEESSI